VVGVRRANKERGWTSGREDITANGVREEKKEFDLMRAAEENREKGEKARAPRPIPSGK